MAVFSVASTACTPRAIRALLAAIRQLLFEIRMISHSEVFEGLKDSFLFALVRQCSLVVEKALRNVLSNSEVVVKVCGLLVMV